MVSGGILAILSELQLQLRSFGLKPAHKAQCGFRNRVFTEQAGKAYLRQSVSQWDPFSRVVFWHFWNRGMQCFNGFRGKWKGSRNFSIQQFRGTRIVSLPKLNVVGFKELLQLNWSFQNVAFSGAPLHLAQNIFCNVRHGLCRILVNYLKGHFDLHPGIFVARPFLSSSVGTCSTLRRF